MPDPVLLSTPRLWLRPHRITDAPFMMFLNADPEVVRYTGDGPFRDLAEAEAVIASLEAQYAARRMGRFLVLERETGMPVGWCGLRYFPESQTVDLGYRFQRDRWGRGYATEAGQACLTYAVEVLGLSSLVAWVMLPNIASARVLEKLGFACVGTDSCAEAPAYLYRWQAPQ